MHLQKRRFVRGQGAGGNHEKTRAGQTSKVHGRNVDTISQAARKSTRSKESNYRDEYVKRKTQSKKTTTCEKNQGERNQSIRTTIEKSSGVKRGAECGETNGGYLDKEERKKEGLIGSQGASLRKKVVCGGTAAAGCNPMGGGSG